MKIKLLLTLLSLVLIGTSVQAAEHNSVLPEIGPNGAVAAKTPEDVNPLAELLDRKTTAGTVEFACIGKTETYSSTTGAQDVFVFLQVYGLPTGQAEMAEYQFQLQVDLFVEPPPIGVELTFAAYGDHLVTWLTDGAVTSSPELLKEVSELRKFGHENLQEPVVFKGAGFVPNLGRVYSFRPINGTEGEMYHFPTTYFSRSPFGNITGPVILKVAEHSDHPAMYWRNLESHEVAHATVSD